MKYFLCVIGMALIIEGLPYFAFPGRMRELMVHIALHMGEEELRLVAMCLMVAGLFLVYIAMKAL